MAGSNVGSIVRHLRWLMSAEQASGLSDHQLLQAFLDQRDEAAFAALVRRHGRLVLGVCRRVLHHVQDAEDVFQATFLILARKAKSIRRREAIGSWLYQTAFRLAQKARVRAQQQRNRENEAAAPNVAHSVDDASWREVLDMLDQELTRLPDKYRAPLLLCYFEGRTQEDAAGQLGWPVRTLQGRLARARELLRRRLERRGLTFGSTLVASALCSDAALAFLPAAIAQKTCEAAALSAVGQPITSAVSSGVATIVEGALRQMATIKILKFAMAVLLLAGFVGSGVGMIIGQASTADENAAQVAKGIQPPVEKPPQPKKPPQQPALPPLLDVHGDELPAGAFLRFGTERMRHGGGVLAVAWSADSNFVATGGSGFDTTVRLWESATGKGIREFTMHRDDLRAVALAPDGNVAASVDIQGTLFLWQTLTGKALASRRVSPNAGVVFASDGKSLATIDDQGQACLVEADSGLKTIRVFKGGPGLQAPLTRVAWSNDGRTVATLNTLNKIVVFEGVTGLVRSTLDNDRKVECISLAPDGKTLASGGADKAIDLWDSKTGKKIRTLQGHTDIIKAVAWSADGKTLASASEDRSARLWNVSDGKETQKFKGHQGPVHCVAIAPDGKRVASGSYVHEYSLHVWDADTGKASVKFDEHYGGMRALAVIDGGKTLISGGNDAMIRLWDLQTGKSTGQFLGRRYHPRSMAVSPDSKLLALGANDGGIRILELPKGNQVQLMKPDNAGVRIVAFSPDGKLLASSNNKKKTLLWDVATGKVVRELKDQPEEMISLAFSPDGKLLATANRKSVLRIWDVATGKEMGRLTGHKGDIEPIVFFPGNRFMATVSSDGTARIWDLTAGKEVRRFDKISNSFALAISPDGRMMATGGGREKVIRLWEVATGKVRATLEGHHGGIVALDFLPDGKSIVSGGTDSTGLCWDLTGRDRNKKQPLKPLTADQLESEWHHLSGNDVARAYGALLTLAEHPQLALGKLKTELQPVAPVDPKLIAQWIANLEDKNFGVREKAIEELKKTREAAWPALQKVLENPPSLETRDRVKLLIGNQDDPFLPIPGRLRTIRSLELLERLHTTAARELMQTLADGAPDAWLTQEAKMMIQRMK